MGVSDIREDGGVILGEGIKPQECRVRVSCMLYMGLRPVSYLLLEGQDYIIL